jgi:hypothetical protein
MALTTFFSNLKRYSMKIIVQKNCNSDKGPHGLLQKNENGSDRLIMC